jgi:EmrB/QacA subfamily drug resistance transporter
MCLALFMTFLDSTVVNVALPSIQHHLHAGIDDLQWVINGYTLVLGVLLITGGRFGDLFGRKRIFLLGMAVFTLGSGFGGFARDVHFLIAARAVQGLGGAMMVPGTLSIITQSFEGAERGMAIGIWSGVSGLAISLGPVLGGLLIDKVSWQSIFYINIPIGLLALCVSWWAVRESRDESTTQRIDVIGVILLSGGLVALTLAFIEGNQQGWTSLFILGSLITAVVLLLIFLAAERRVANPILDLGLFRSPTFSGANVAAITSTFGTFSFYFFTTLYMQEVLGYSALKTGLRLLPQAVLLAIVPPIAGKLTDRYGSRPLLVAGQVVTVLSMLIVVWFVADYGYAALLPALMLGGLGMGLMYTPLSTAIMGSVSRHRSGAASGMMNTMRQVGGTLGVAVVGAFFSHQVAAHFLAGAHRVNIDRAVGPELATRVAGAGAGVAAAVPADVAQQVAAAARDAFTSGLSQAALVDAAIVFLGMLPVLLFVRRPAAPIEEVALRPNTETEAATRR